MGEELFEREPPENPLAKRKTRRRVELRPARLHDAAKVDPTRTDALAVATHETQLEVLAVRISRLDAACVERFDQVDAAARCRGLLAGEHIRRAVLQAQAAVN